MIEYDPRPPVRAAAPAVYDVVAAAAVGVVFGCGNGAAACFLVKIVTGAVFCHDYKGEKNSRIRNLFRRNLNVAVGTEQQTLPPYYAPYAPAEVVGLIKDVTRMQAAFNNVYF